MKLIYLALLLTLVSSCTPMQPDAVTDAAENTANSPEADPFKETDSATPAINLVQARSLWKDAQPGNYEFTQQRHCYCRREYTKPVIVVVMDGVIVSANYQDSGKPVPAGVRKTVRTIDEWLDFIATRQLNNPYEFNARFDNRYGHPIRYRVDQRENVADDEEEVWFSEFRVLP